jgi:6-pyruvoyltetrahydropterin/6-carboxytetrahydropterin synthase
MTASYTHEVPMGHRLQHHTGKCKYPHGHNYLVTVSYEGPVSTESGMVIDFSQLKKVTREVLEPYDHSFCLETTDPLFELLHNLVDLPRIIALPFPPTAENLAHVWRDTVAGELAIDKHQIHIRVNETRDCAVYL